MGAEPAAVTITPRSSVSENPAESSPPLLEDWLFRQSSIVDSVVNKRWGCLYPDYFVTFRKQKDSKPSKKLPLVALTITPAVSTGTFKIRKQHRNTVLALATGSCEEKVLHYFALHSAKQGSKLLIAFEDRDKACKWHQVTTNALHAHKSHVIPRATSASRKQWQKSGIEGAGTHSRRHSGAEDTLAAFSSRSPLKANSKEENPSPFEDNGATIGGRGMGSSGCVGSAHMEDCAAFSDPDPEMDWLAAVTSEDVGGDISSFLAPATSSVDDFRRKWRSVQHVNGVAVYTEVEDGGGDGAKMVSLTVRCTPQSCFKAIMRYAFENFEVVETVDEHTCVLRGRFERGSMPLLLAAPREVLLQRTWRRDQDGSFIILLQDAQGSGRAVGGGGGGGDNGAGDAAAASGAGGAAGGSGSGSGGTGGSAVRAHVAAFGFIIAPVAAEYLPPGAGCRATECLVTTVAKVDAGGWLSKRCLLGRLLAATPLAPYTTDGWLRPLVHRVITLRDVVEQERFIRKPFDSALTTAPCRGRGGSETSTPKVPGPTVAGGERDDLGEEDQQPAPSMLSVLHPARHRQSLSRFSSYSFQPASFTSPKGMAGGGSLPSPMGSPKGSFGALGVEEVELGEEEEDDGGRRWAGGTLGSSMWSCPGAAGWKIRGPNYLVDRKKVAATEPVFALSSVDILKSVRPAEHIGRFLPSCRFSEAPFTFILNVMVPANPPLSLVISWAADYTPESKEQERNNGGRGQVSNGSDGAAAAAGGGGSAKGSASSLPAAGGTTATSAAAVAGGSGDSAVDEEEDDWDSEEEGADGAPRASPFDLCLARFLAGTDEQRNGKFKLIPRIPEGSWVIKQSVGTTPVILGRKLTTKYFRGDGYLEVAIDIGSSSVAASVVNLVQGATKSLVIDMAVLLEGHSTDELPEQLLGAVRLNRMDLSTAPWLDLDTGRIMDKRPG